MADNGIPDDHELSDLEDIVLRQCPHCKDVLDHLVRDGDEHCTGCGAVNEGGEPGDCRNRECAFDATHMIVSNPVGRDERVTEEYCEYCVEDAAYGIEQDPGAHLFYGPEKLERTELG